MQKIILNPGIDRQKTQTLNNNGWSFANLMRWRYGLAEKMGGWQQLIATPVPGSIRGLHAWEDLSAVNYLAIGSNERLELYTGGNIFDITPIRKTDNITPSFSTVIHTTAVTVTDVANAVAVGDWIDLFIPVSVGGVVLLGFYKVQTVIDADNFTITSATAATATVSNTGTVPQFTTVMSSDSVTVNLPNNGLALSAPFEVQISTAVGGVTLVGFYLVDTIVDADNFTILAASGASSGDVQSENGGDARIIYLLPSGLASDTILLGWGGGTWGSGTWGVGAGTTAVSPLRNWYLDNFGQNLVALPTNGTLYQWVPPIASGNVATPVVGAPLFGLGMFVAMPQAQIVIYGAETGSVQDPLLIRWCDNGDYTDWTATSSNQAGSYRLSKGSKIVGGIQAPQFGIIWTDTDAWLMQYIQPPFIYGFNIIGNGVGLIASKACTILGNTIYWTSIRGFFTYSGSGGVQPLPCSVYDVIFRNLDLTNASKVFMGSNSLFNEVMTFFPSSTGGTGEIDSYVKFNNLENLWDYGNLVRLAWIDDSVLGNPIGADSGGLLQQHETGYDDNGAPMDSFIESGYADIDSGEFFIMINWLIPDFVLTGTNATVNITLYAVEYPDGPQTVYGPFTVTSSTTYINVRCRARQVAIKVENDTLGTFWRIGAIRYRGAKSGKR